MTPAEFIDRLSRHYSKRHESTASQSAWLKEMVDSVKGTDPRVLDRAYELVRDEHEERAFPLPATLKKFIARSAELVHPERTDRSYGWSGRSLRAPDSPEMIEAIRRGHEYQSEQIRRYGSWEAQWRATQHMHKSAKVSRRQNPALPSTVRLTLPASKVRRISVRTNTTAAIDRIAMHHLQERSQTGLHVDISSLTKRMTGDRT